MYLEYVIYLQYVFCNLQKIFLHLAWCGRKRHNHSTFSPSILSHNVPFYTLFHKTNYFGKTAFLARTGDKVKVSDHSIFAYMQSDMEFVQNFTPPDFQAKNFTPSISPNFNSFSKKKHKQ